MGSCLKAPPPSLKDKAYIRRGDDDDDGDDDDGKSDKV